MTTSCYTSKVCSLKTLFCSVSHHDPCVLEFTPVIPTLSGHGTSQRSDLMVACSMRKKVYPVVRTFK